MIAGGHLKILFSLMGYIKHMCMSVRMHARKHTSIDIVMYDTACYVFEVPYLTLNFKKEGQ